MIDFPSASRPAREFSGPQWQSQIAEVVRLRRAKSCNDFWLSYLNHFVNNVVCSNILANMQSSAGRIPKIQWGVGNFTYPRANSSAPKHQLVWMHARTPSLLKKREGAPEMGTKPLKALRGYRASNRGSKNSNRSSKGL